MKMFLLEPSFLVLGTSSLTFVTREGYFIPVLLKALILLQIVCYSHRRTYSTLTQNQFHQQSSCGCRLPSSRGCSCWFSFSMPQSSLHPLPLLAQKLTGKGKMLYFQTRGEAILQFFGDHCTTITVLFSYTTFDFIGFPKYLIVIGFEQFATWAPSPEYLKYHNNKCGKETQKTRKGKGGINNKILQQHRLMQQSKKLKSTLEDNINKDKDLFNIFNQFQLANLIDGCWFFICQNDSYLSLWLNDLKINTLCLNVLIPTQVHPNQFKYQQIGNGRANMNHLQSMPSQMKQMHPSDEIVTFQFLFISDYTVGCKQIQEKLTQSITIKKPQYIESTQSITANQKVKPIKLQLKVLYLTEEIAKKQTQNSSNKPILFRFSLLLGSSTTIEYPEKLLITHATKGQKGSNETVLTVAQETNKKETKEVQKYQQKLLTRNMGNINCHKDKEAAEFQVG